jgi:hypothetical protein
MLDLEELVYYQQEVSDDKLKQLAERRNHQVSNKID